MATHFSNETWATLSSWQEDFHIDRPVTSTTGSATIVAPSEGKPSNVTARSDVEPQDDFHPSFRLWVIIAGLSVTGLLAALENTVIAVAAPAILTELELGENFIWVNSAFFLCSAAFQPLIGQLCNVFGRRWPMMTVVALFVFGSGLCGGATNGAMLIAGRAIQGAGSGGIMLLIDIIVSDLVPLRQRGNYVSVILGIYGVGMALGPFIGGAIVTSTTWRWVFYLNLPIGAVSLAMLFVLLHVNYNKEMAFKQKIQRIDFIGNAVLMASTVAIMFALAYAGTVYMWNDWHTLLPLLLGLTGFFLFAFLQARGVAKEPVMPARLFNNRTSIILAINTWINSALAFWGFFFLPVYFQAVLLYSPRRTGVAMLPVALVAIPGSVIAAISLSRWGLYRPIHTAGFALLTLGVGLCALLREDTTVAQWAVYQCVAALGIGMLLNTQLPAFQAPVPERDQAAATSAWCFIRTFGFIWGVVIPAAIFNNRIAALAGAVSDPVASQMMAAGGAFGAASASQVEMFPPVVQDEIRAVYTAALQRVFQISIAFAGLATVLSLFEKEFALRTNLETEFGLKQEHSESTQVIILPRMETKGIELATKVSTKRSEQRDIERYPTVQRDNDLDIAYPRRRSHA